MKYYCRGIGNNSEKSCSSKELFLGLLSCMRFIKARQSHDGGSLCKHHMLLLAHRSYISTHALPRAANYLFPPLPLYFLTLTFLLFHCILFIPFYSFCSHYKHISSASHFPLTWQSRWNSEPISYSYSIFGIIVIPGHCHWVKITYCTSLVSL